MGISQVSLARTGERWPELDLMRGLAAILMVLNHVGVRSPALESNKFISNLVFVGSFAPVVFFFLTGLGYGVQSLDRPSSRGLAYLPKIAIIFAADSLLWIRPSQWWGNDFLGFIGLNMLLLEWLRHVSRSGLLAFCLAGLVVVSRYTIGPLLLSILGDSTIAHFFCFVTGTSVIPGFSYALCPWLAFPLLGYVLGRASAFRFSMIQNDRFPFVGALVGFGMLFSAVAFLLQSRGMPFFRYGSMSFGFFVASFAALAFVMAFSLAMLGVKVVLQRADWVSLTGIRSFAFVPLHYALIPVTAFFVCLPIGHESYLFNVTVVVVVSFVASLFVPGVGSLIRRTSIGSWFWVIITTVYVSAMISLGRGWIPLPLTLPVRTSVQLGLSILLVIPIVRPEKRSHIWQTGRLPTTKKVLAGGPPAS